MAWMLAATSDPPIPSNRIPGMAYENQNGFTYRNYPGPISRAPEEDRSEPTTVALNAHRRAQYVLTQKDRPIPTFERMQEEVLQGDMVASLKQRIADLQEQHLSDMRRLYTWHAEEYHDEAFNQYLAKDDLQYLTDGENNPVLKQSYADLETMYEETRKNVPMQMQWEDDIERMRHSHIVLLNDLYSKLKNQEAADEDARKRREADFPTSIEEYKAKPKEIQTRVARFLTSDSAIQEKMLTQFGWASRQVKPMQEIFQKNAAFNADIILQLIGDVQDPRMR